MREPAQSPSRGRALLIVGVCIIALILSSIVVIPLLTNKNQSATDNDTIFLNLIQQSSLLQSETENLQSLNDKYALLLSDQNMDSAKLKTLDSLNIAITHDEASFSNLIDSVQMNASSYDKNSFDLFNRILASYRFSLKQSTALSIIRNSFTAKNTDYDINDTLLLSMQNAMRNKEAENINLTNELNALRNSNTVVNTPPVNLKKTDILKDTAAIALLQDEKTKNENLISYNDKLERTNKNLQDELNNLRTASAQNKSSATDQTKAQLNAAVNLEKVNCYLLRADAKQIISNANQRKDLLEDALAILNSLSQSGDPAIVQQAKAKLAQLKIIAAQNHD